MSTQYDVAVIGSGPGGYIAAIRASQLGLKTALIERDRLGGVCLNWGCIPSKSLLKNAEMVSHLKHAGDFGIQFDNLRIDFAKVIERSRAIADRMNRGVQFLMKKNKIDVIAGTAKFQDKNTLQLTSATGESAGTVAAKKFIIATGARARSIPGVTIDNETILDSTGALSLNTLPSSIVIIGAGAIGVEFAYFYNAMGAQVTLIEMMPHIVPLEDTEVAQSLQRAFKKQGITILTEAKVESINASGSVTVRVSQNGETQTVQAEKALIAIGVQGNSDSLNLDKIGVKTERSFIVTDRSTYRTSVPHIYAIGDVNGPPLLAHAASHEAVVCVEKLAGLDTPDLNYDCMPAGTYCQPQVASVGLTEQKAKDKGFDVKVGKFPFTASGKAVAIGETEGFVKLVFDAKTKKLLGAHILGSDATEMLSEVTLAISMGATVEDFLHTIHAHPTLGECSAEAAGAAFNMALNI